MSKVDHAYSQIAQVLLNLKAQGLTTEQLVAALVRAANEAGITNYDLTAPYFGR